MRHNQNSRHMRGGRRDGGGRHQHGGNNHSNHGNQQRQRVNPRVQTFDSNGPEVRIRGNAYQINEKYVTLARDAASAGDRVLAESYLQHAEHYQRMINEMNEEYAKHNPPQQHNPQHQPQPYQHQQGGGHQQGMGGQPSMNGGMGDEQPDVMVTSTHQPQPQPNMQRPDDGLEDLDQSFLVGPRHSTPRQHVETKTVDVSQQQPDGNNKPEGGEPRPRRHYTRHREGGAV